MHTPWGDVALSRSPSGMPVLEALTEPAAYFGLGYAQAADDADTLLRQYLLVRGELASAPPSTSRPDSTDAAERDANQRRWRVLDEARAAFDSLPGEVQEGYRGFSAGVRAWLDENPDSVPHWTPPLEPALAIGVNRTIMLYWVIADAVVALEAAGVALPPVVSELHRTPMVPGSNAWVIRPWRTRDGETFLVSDPHLPFGGACTLHEATVIVGDLHYTGFSFLGAMLPALAHNANCGWGVTTGGPRVSDAYRVPDTDRDAVVLNGVRSPIVARQDGVAYAICSPYTGHAADTELQLRDMLRAASVDDLRSALDRRAFPPQNVLAADRLGNAFYQRTGRVPRRTATMTGVLEPHQLWEGHLEPHELVHLENPESGYLQNCNTAPDLVAPELDAADWSADSFNDLPGRQNSRGLRSVALLCGAIDIDSEDVTAWAVDDTWQDTVEWQAGLVAALTAQPRRVAGWPAERRALLRTLLDFDGHAAPASRAASGWLSWRLAIASAPETPERLRELALAFDADLLLGAVETCAIDDRPYGTTHTVAAGIPGRGGGFVARPGTALDLTSTEQVPLRATYFSDGVAVGGGPAIRIVRWGADGMTSWSLQLPKDAAAYSRGELLPTAFHPSQAVRER